jgi:hypothetical protein
MVMLSIGGVDVEVRGVPWNTASLDAEELHHVTKNKHRRPINVRLCSPAGADFPVHIYNKTAQQRRRVITVKQKQRTARKSRTSQRYRTTMMPIGRNQRETVHEEANRRTKLNM